MLTLEQNSLHHSLHLSVYSNSIFLDNKQVSDTAREENMNKPIIARS